MKCIYRSAVILALSALLSLPLLAAGAPREPQYSISVGPIRESTAVDGLPSKDFTVEVKEGERVAHRFVVSAPSKVFNLQEEPRTLIVGDRLLVYTLRLITVFDLQEGRQVFDGFGRPSIVATSDGHRVAYKENQLPFTAPEATTTVIQVLDVTTLEQRPVFPEKSLIERSQNGLLKVWEEDPLKRHSVDELVWSPDGSRLAFFCTHGELGLPDKPHPLYLAVVDLRQGLDKSRFIHRPFDWKPYLKKGVAPKDQKPYFAFDSMTWSADDTLIVKPPPNTYWLQNPMIIPLANFEKELGKGD